MIQVINRALDILEILSQDVNKEFGLKEIADKLKLNHSTCANIIKTMINRGYVDKDKGYRLGRQAFYLTNNFSNEKELIQYSIEPMQKISAELNESCILAIIKNSSRITLHKITSYQELQANTKDEKHIYQTATGRVLLAYMDIELRNSFIRTFGLPGVMWEKANNEQSLIQELKNINKQGFSIHYADSNIIGIAVPVFNKNKVIASLGIYLPESRYNKTIKQKILIQIQEAARTISEKITKNY